MVMLYIVVFKFNIDEGNDIMIIKQKVLYEKKEECCGCTACYAICPNSAISMIEDSEGFLYPHIDTEKCVNCNMCLKVCPIKIIRKCENS